MTAAHIVSIVSEVVMDGAKRRQQVSYDSGNYSLYSLDMKEHESVVRHTYYGKHLEDTYELKLRVA